MFWKSAQSSTRFSDQLRDLENSFVGGLNYVVALECCELTHAADRSPDVIITDGYPDAVVCSMRPITTEDVLQTFESDLCYRGDHGAGPGKRTFTSQRFKTCLEVVRSRLESYCESASDIYEFSLSAGHPGYPVFWDHAFLFRFDEHSLIYIGSSSD